MNKLFISFIFLFMLVGIGNVLAVGTYPALNVTGTNLSQFQTKGGWYVDFNGINTEILSITTSFANLNSTQGLQVYVFAKFNSFRAVSQNLVSKYSSANKGWMFRTNGDNLKLDLYNSTGSAQTIEDNEVISYENWELFGFKINDSGYTLIQRNNSAIAYGYLTNSDGGTGLAPLKIGSRSSEFFNGSIGEVLITNNSDLWSGHDNIIYQESKFGGDRSQSIPIIYYHMINNTPDNGVSILNKNVELFAQDMAYLNSSGFKTVSAKNIYDWQQGNFVMPSKPIHIDFDDAWISVFRNAYPIMLNYSFTGTIGIPTSLINDVEHYHINWTELKNMSDAGWEMASHATSFEYTGMTALTDAQQIAELNNSYWAIYNNLSVVPYYFIYPANSRNSSTDINCAKFYKICSGANQGGHVYRDSNLTNNTEFFRGGMGDNAYNISASGKWSFKNRVDVYQNVLLHFKMNEGIGNITFSDGNKAVNGTIFNGNWSNNFYYFKNIENVTNNLSIVGLTTSLIYNSTSYKVFTGNYQQNMTSLYSEYVLDNYSFSVNLNSQVRDGEPFFNGINLISNPFNSNVNFSVQGLTSALLTNGTSLCNGSSSNLALNTGQVNITLNPNGFCYVLDNYNLTEGVTRENSPINITSKTNDGSTITYQINSSLLNIINNLTFYPTNTPCQGVSYISKNGLFSEIESNCSGGFIDSIKISGLETGINYLYINYYTPGGGFGGNGNNNQTNQTDNVINTTIPEIPYFCNGTKIDKIILGFYDMDWSISITPIHKGTESCEKMQFLKGFLEYSKTGNFDYSITGIKLWWVLSLGILGLIILFIYIFGKINGEVERARK